MTSPPNVTTSQYSIARTGANTNETCLSAATWSNRPSPSIKVKYATVPANGSTNSPVYAEPLYVYNLPIGPDGASRNVVFIATLDDYVYAYDADNYTATQYYGVSLINDLQDCNLNNKGIPIPHPGGGLPRAGIVSTPVIFLPPAATPTLTVVGGCQDSSTGADSWYLHALNLLTGQDLNTPIQIGASVSSSDGAAGCTGTNCDTLTFNPRFQLQRPALLQIPDGTRTQIYVAFGVNGASETKYTTNPYHGWLIGYMPGQSNPTFKFVTTPTGLNTNTTTPCTNNSGDAQTNKANTCGLGAGIWMAGKGIVAYNDSGTRYVYVGSGNGGFQTGNTNWGSSVLGFVETATGTPPTTTFTPYRYRTLNYYDQDMGTSGPLLTDAYYLTIFDKTGQGYVLNPTSLGGFTSTDSGAVGEFQGSLTNGGTCNGSGTGCDEITSQVYWNGYLFLWPWNEDVDWCLWNGSNNFQCYPNNQNGGNGIFPVGFPGGTLALSSNGDNQSTAILWGIVLKNTAAPFIDPGTDLASYSGYLFAYQLQTAPTMSGAGSLVELWNSSADTWTAGIFAMPTVVNGRVYVPTYDQGVIVYANY
ncbi:MAG: hypothetical protein ABSH32_13980 [Bryobacteraceae bacterium]